MWKQPQKGGERRSFLSQARSQPELGINPRTESKKSENVETVEKISQSEIIQEEPKEIVEVESFNDELGADTELKSDEEPESKRTTETDTISKGSTDDDQDDDDEEQDDEEIIIKKSLCKLCPEQISSYMTEELDYQFTLADLSV